MKRSEYIGRFEAAAHVQLIGNQSDRVIALAQEHTGSLLIEDIEVCRGEGVGFAQWLKTAETEFPVAATILREADGDLFYSHIIQRLNELNKEKRKEQRDERRGKN